MDGLPLKYAHVETERRFLMRALPAGAGPARIAHTPMYLDDTEWAVLCRLPARSLRKRRHHIERDGFSLAVDEFENGSLIAEIDGGDDRPADPPGWLDVLGEVTDDEAFTGAARASADFTVTE